ncbi:hemerythrin domain-containing protein [Phycicoccus sp. BSK3Z-2]|uniref:Hemerythrin domain-containing protein n=1 Tax=Phycicoccus avicenniae TaxID=2828860 RepID=A0A941DAV7_9MICO|nr:hemerythrin domain-containing protein [Phycicoccus avicenniae]MBR7744303.1 hemerythrin domain-containing protein [Phycicoccus avicenniae]
MSEDPSADATRAVAIGRELRRLHVRLRELLDDARAGLDPAVVAAGLLADPVSHCRAFCTALTEHHEGEDVALFPWLLRLRPGMSAVVGRLEEDHRLVATLLEAVAEELDGREDPAMLVRHLDGLDAIMESHFRYEERQLVPVLEELSAAGPRTGRPTSAEPEVT